MLTLTLTHLHLSSVYGALNPPQLSKCFLPESHLNKCGWICPWLAHHLKWPIRSRESDHIQPQRETVASDAAPSWQMCSDVSEVSEEKSHFFQNIFVGNALFTQQTSRRKRSNQGALSGKCCFTDWSKVWIQLHMQGVFFVLTAFYIVDTHWRHPVSGQDVWNCIAEENMWLKMKQMTKTVTEMLYVRRNITQTKGISGL